MTIIDIVSGVLLAAGALFVLSGGVGLLRFPDFYTRTHASGITDSAGAGLILLGLLFLTPGWETGVRLVIIMVFLALTSPTATYVLAFAARRDGVPIWREGDRRR
jgi:multicomponent Na+:H+ antiporter subunit G